MDPYSPTDRVELPWISGCEELAGIAINPEQTFGFEFEIGGYRSRQRWEEVAGALVQVLREVVPVRGRPGGRKTEVSTWKVVNERSCGWEVNTRVLQGIDGVREVIAGLDALRAAMTWLRVEHTLKTAMHVHLGWPRDLTAMSRLVEIVAYFEPALVSLVEKHRLSSRYCKSIANDIDAFRANKTLQDWATFYVPWARRRDHVISLRTLIRGIRTVEVRLHHGTFDSLEVVPWLALWMSILNAARRGDLPFPADGWDPSADRDASERQSISALCRFTRADGVLEARLIDTCEKHVRNWAGGRSRCHGNETEPR